MWWIIGVFVVIAILSGLDDLIELAKSKKEPSNDKDDISKKRDLITLLERYQGADCILTVNQLVVFGFSSERIKAKIISVDEDWVEFIEEKKNKMVQKVMRIECITDVSRVIG